MIPTQDEARKVAGSQFWTAVIAVWLVMVAIAVTLFLALGIWILIGAF